MEKLKKFEEKGMDSSSLKDFYKAKYKEKMAKREQEVKEEIR